MITSGIEYSLKRTRRRTVAIQIKKDGTVVVCAPFLVSKSSIEDFIKKKSDWILKKKQLVKQHPANELSELELTRLTALAKEILPERCRHFAEIMDLQYSGVKITRAATRWGSCSHKNSLCFSCRLMLMSQEAQDYVVVHELAHVVHKNHSKQFWSVVESIMPDYKERRKMLRP